MRVPRTSWAVLCTVAVTFVGTSLAEHVVHVRAAESADEWKMCAVQSNMDYRKTRADR